MPQILIPPARPDDLQYLGGSSMEPEMSWSTVLAGATIGGFAAWTLLLGPLFVIYTLYRHTYRPRKAFRELLRSLGAVEEERSRFSCANVQGREVLLRYIPNGEQRADLYGNAADGSGAIPGTPDVERGFPLISTRRGPVLEVALACDLPVSFAFTLESATDKLAKRSGVSSELQTGDREFDRLVYVTCDRPDLLRAFLTPERRRAILKLLNGGFQQIRCAHLRGQLVLVSTASFLRDSPGAREISTASEMLSKLVADGGSFSAASASPATAQAEVQPPPAQSPSRRGKTMAFIAVALSMWFFLNFDSWSREIVSGQGLVTYVSAIAVLAAALISARTVRRDWGSSTAHRTIPQAIIVSGVLAFAVTWSAVVFGNAVLDPSDAVTQEGKFLRVSEHRGMSLAHRRRLSGASLTADFVYEEKDRSMREVSVLVSESEAARLKGHEDAAAVISLKPGAFGFRHATSFTLK